MSRMNPAETDELPERLGRSKLKTKKVLLIKDNKDVRVGSKELNMFDHIVHS